MRAARHSTDVTSIERSRRNAGVTLIELMIVLAIAGALMGITTFNMRAWADNQRAKDAARAVADAFMLARGEALRTGQNHIVVFGQGLAPADTDVVIAADDRPSNSNCSFALGDIVHRKTFGQGVNFGTTATLSNGLPAPNDNGIAAGGVPGGTSFSTAAKNPLISSMAIYFEPDGIPRIFTTDGFTCTARGLPGEGGGGIYVTNGERDFAIVLMPLGTARVVSWNRGTGAWES